MKHLFFALFLFFSSCASSPVSTVKSYNAINKTLALDSNKLQEDGKMFLIAANQAIAKMNKDGNDVQLQAIATMLHRSEALLGVKESDKIDIINLDKALLDKKLESTFNEDRKLLLRDKTLTKEQEIAESILINKGVEAIHQEQDTFWGNVKSYSRYIVFIVAVIAIFVYIPPAAVKPFLSGIGNTVGRLFGRQ